MSTLTMKHFDLLNFVNKSTELGMSKPLAEYQARQLEEVIEIAAASNQESFENKNLTLKKEIQELEYAFQNDFKGLDVRMKELDTKIVVIQKDIQALQKDIKTLELKIKEVDSDLKIKIEQSKNQILIWIGSLIIASGFISHFFK